MRRLPFLVIAAIALSALFAGCTKEEGGGTAGGAADDGKLSIVFIPKNTGNPYFDDVSRGFEEACKELGADYTTTGPAKAEATAQISFIEEQVQRGVDVIAISANSPDALNATLDAAREKGVIVITVDSDLTGNEEHRDAGILPVDFDQVGAQQVELLGSQIGYAGDFAILSATTDAPNQNKWIEGMKETLKDSKYAGMKLVEVAYGNDEPQKSTTEFEALLAKYPNLKGVISPTSVGLAAAAQSLELAGAYPGGPNAKNGGLYLTGLSTPNQLKKAVDKGVVKGFALWSPSDMGYIAAHLGAAIKKGTVKPGPGVEFEAGKLGKKTIGEKGVIIAGPMTVFDKGNIAGFDF